MINFVILSTQRSGTSYLASLLDSHPDIRCRGELFYGKSDHPTDYFNTNSAPICRVKRRVFAKQMVVAYMNELREQEKLSHAFGFRLMYHQIMRFPQIIGWMKREQVKVVHLVRSNMLKRLVSHKIAKKTMDYHFKTQVPIEKVHIPLLFLKQRLAIQSALIQQFRERLSTECSFIEVTYETLVAQNNAECRRILQFLDVDNSFCLNSELTKLLPDNLEELIENYDQVHQSLDQSRFAGLLYD